MPSDHWLVVGRERKLNQYPDSSHQFVPNGGDSSKPSSRESDLLLVIYSNAPLLCHEWKPVLVRPRQKDQVYLSTHHTWLNYTIPGPLDIGSTYPPLWHSSTSARR